MDATCVSWTLPDPCPGNFVGCEFSYAKTKLKPILVTASTAKLAFVVPRQSVIPNPTKAGWTLTVTRGGTNTTIAKYTIAEYDRGSSRAIFFIDDLTRNAQTGYYVGTVEKDCCIVAKAILHIECDDATDIQVIDFTHDPSPLGCEDTSLKPAKCEPVCTPAPVIDVCEACKTC